jgi:hypothetical protein
MDKKEKIKGAIIVYSCHKHKDIRLKKFKLNKDNYGGYKVFYVLGNPNINTEYVLIKNTLLIKCPDSYIHLLIKVVKAFEIINNLYDIQEGILRVGDDLHINETKLVNFINNNKNNLNYIGHEVDLKKIYNNQTKYQNLFMYDYYKSHQEDFNNNLHSLQKYSVNDIFNMNYVPVVSYVGGVIYYISKKSINILVKHLQNINYDIFKSNETDGYPYIIEDIAVGYILNKNNIFPINLPLYSDNKEIYDIFPLCFGIHTNYLK